MLDARVALAKQVLEEITRFSHLPHEKDKSLTKLIVRDIEIFQGHDFLNPTFCHTCCHVQKLFIVELTGV